MEQQQGGGGGGDGAKRVTHYSSDHQILLVGEGDFSFSLCLAHAFGSAANIVASSLDSYDDVNKKYKQAKSNLDELQKLGACLLHGVDATKMKLHPDLKTRRFDRVIFNFPHAGFHGKEDNLAVIKMHKDLVLGFFNNASCMLRANGEIHVNHKTSAPFSKWDIERLAMQSLLMLIERAEFMKEDYPGYNNKRGDSYRCDEPFPLGKCSTFKFIFNPRAMGTCKRREKMGSREQISLPFQGKQDAGPQLPTTSVDLNCYPQSSRISKFNKIVKSLFALSNGHTSITGGYLNNVIHTRAAPCAGYSGHGMAPASQRLLQPLQPMEPLNSFQPWPTSTNVRYSQTDHGGLNSVAHTRAAPCDGYSRHGMIPGSQRLLQPMEPLNSFLPWPTSTNVRYSQTDHVRTTDVVPQSLGARNEGYQVFSGSSNYLQEAHGRTSHSANYSCERVRPEFESYISEVHWKALNGDRPEFKSHISEVHWKALNGNNYVHSELPRMNMMEERRMFVGS